MLKSSNIQNRTLHFNHYLIRKKRSKTNDKQNLKKHFKEKYDFSGQRRVSVEYIMFSGINDTVRHVNELARLLNGLKCRINLIRFHTIPDSPLRGSDDATINIFMEKLNTKGITTTIRASRGQDIGAACGLLSTKEMLKKDNLANEDF